MSKSTVVSLLPVAFNERKPGIYPGLFDIEPAPKNGFEILIVGNSVAHVYMDESRGSMTIIQESETVARSLVEDYINSCIAVDKLNECYPGLFWLEGVFDRADIVGKHADKLAKAKESQNRWFHALVKMADDDWSQNRSHKSITGIQRHAATALEDFIGKREWNTQVNFQAYRACRFCTSQIPTEALVCSVCGRAQVPEEQLKELVK